MKILKKYPLFLILMPAFFFLHGAVENFGIIRLSSSIKLGAFILFCILVLFFLINRGLKNKHKAAIVCLYITIWYLFFGAVQDSLSALPHLIWLQKFSILLPILFLSTIALIFFLKKKDFNLSKLFLFFNILFSLYCFFDIFSLVKKDNYYKNLFKENKITFNTRLVKHKPNVYFMIFDEYPGYNSLKDSFSFKNDSLYQFLNNNNFKILPSFSNYNFTLFSIPSIINMNYITHKPFGKYVTVDEFKQRSREIKNTKFFSIFESMGYEFKNYSIFDINNNPGIGYTFSLNIGNDELITDKMLHARLIKNVGWLFITGKFSIPFFKKYVQKHQPNEYNKKVELALETALINKSKIPQFLYLHFLLPHAPYYYNENGVLEDNASLYKSRSTAIEKVKFLGYLKYTNLKMKGYVNQIIRHDSTGIIICMSDHGYRAYTQQGENPISAVFDNICAVRFPNNNFLPLKEKCSNVNFFRYFFNCQFNQNFSYLKDTSFFLKMESTIR